MKGYQAMPVKHCGECRYFREHYTKISRGRYRALEYGHCVHPRLKKRRAEEYCPHWCARQKDTPAVL